METVIVHVHSTYGLYFFSTDHSQTLPDGYVSITFYLGHTYKTLEDVQRIQLYDMTEVPNPDPAYAPVYAMRGNPYETHTENVL